MVDNLNLQNIIYTFRGEQVMLDSDLAALYGVEVKRLNQAVKRNSERFPEEFCFQLDDLEVEVLRSQDTVSRLGLNRGGENLRSQNVTSSLEFNRGGENLRSQNVTSSLSEYGGRRYRPYVFTEQVENVLR